MPGIEQVVATQAALKKAAPQLKQLKESCQGLEASFMKQLVQMMRKGAGDVHFGKDLGGDAYKDMFDDALSNMLAANETSGVEQAMYEPLANQVLKQQMSAIAATKNQAVAPKEESHS
ncbi:MAG TPA: hypothetical protein VG944_19940 [Fimbriimonas sp.]|nr:hypothetical protein [Fimbriimonas sp.]